MKNQNLANSNPLKDDDLNNAGGSAYNVTAMTQQLEVFLASAPDLMEKDRTKIEALLNYCKEGGYIEIWDKLPAIRGISKSLYTQLLRYW